MMTSKPELHTILFKWLQTLELKPGLKDITELSDGVLMAQALSQIDSDWFNESWLAKIKTDTGDNWRLKLSNLKKILEQVLDYYNECFNQPLIDFRKPDAVKIGDKADPKEIGRMLQLILGCAVNCVSKQTYIETIMTMDESEQRVLMECIQELDSERALSFSQSLHLEAPQLDLDQLVSQLNESNASRNKLAQRCNELELQVQVLTEEKDALFDEKRKLQDQVEAVTVDTGSNALRRQMDTLKGEVFKMETSRDDYKQRYEEKDREITDLRTKLEEASRMAAEARHLKDELDVLRETADRVEKCDATIAQYKKKLEEAADLKREVKQLEAKNLSFIQQNMDMEQELKKATFWRTQFESYKKQVTELQERLDEEINRGDRLNYEVKSVQEKLSATKREKERLIMERDSLREANEEMKCCIEQQGGNGAVTVDGDQPLPSAVEDLDVSHAELRQRVARLRHENNMLKASAASGVGLGTNGDGSEGGDSLSVLQTLLEDTKQQLEKVRRENREANQKIIHLEGELKEVMTVGGGNNGDVNATALMSRLNEMQLMVQRDKQRYSMLIEEKDHQLNELKELMTQLRDKLSQKELELQELEDKHKKYVDKARMTLKVFDGMGGLDLKDAATALGAGSSSSAQHREQLMATSFHNLARDRHRETSDQRMASIGIGVGLATSAMHPQSTYLSRQRTNSLRKQQQYRPQ